MSRTLDWRQDGSYWRAEIGGAWRARCAPGPDGVHFTPSVRHVDTTMVIAPGPGVFLPLAKAQMWCEHVADSGALIRIDAAAAKLLGLLW